jgi:hypothetical protein
MKRFVLVVVALAAVGMFAACKKDKKKDGEVADPAAKPADTAGADMAKPEDKPADPTTAGATDPAGATVTPAGATDPAAAATAESTGVPECDAFVKRQMECEKYPQASKDAVKASVQAWKDQAAKGADAAKSVADGCKKAAEAADAQLKAAGC